MTFKRQLCTRHGSSTVRKYKGNRKWTMRITYTSILSCKRFRTSSDKQVLRDLGSWLLTSRTQIQPWHQGTEWTVRITHTLSLLLSQWPYFILTYHGNLFYHMSSFPVYYWYYTFSYIVHIYNITDAKSWKTNLGRLKSGFLVVLKVILISYLHCDFFSYVMKKKLPPVVINFHKVYWSSYKEVL